jgi:hypothetical protein
MSKDLGAYIRVNFTESNGNLEHVNISVLTEESAKKLLAKVEDYSTDDSENAYFFFDGDGVDTMLVPVTENLLKLVNGMTGRSKDLKTLVDYCYETEKKHFEESDKPADHIFNVIKRIKTQL